MTTLRAVSFDVCLKICFRLVLIDWFATSPSTMSSTPAADPREEDELDLRTQVRAALKNLTRREPIEPTYKHLLMNGDVTPRRPTLPKDKQYRAIGANLRERVTQFTEHPWDRIANRQPFDEAAMRAAFTLRENKKHEQEALLNVTLAARNPRNNAAYKRKLEGMAMTLQNRRPKKGSKPSLATPVAATVNVAQDNEARKAERERQQHLQQQRAREAARRQREEQESREEEERRARMREEPQLALQRLYQPIFQVLWDMEFDNLGGTNPFRIIIDRNNCAAMGAPDYFDIIEKPMNLTYIKDKVPAAQYETLEAFFADVDLLLNNALLYNSDPNNNYHIAAKEMKRKYKKIAKKVLLALQQHTQRTS